MHRELTQPQQDKIHETRITILGCGPSGGVPLIGCDCPVCQSNNPKNQRSRASIMVEQGNTRLIVDTSPDLRAQALRHKIKTIDAILYTHAHADHCHGIDDARAFNYHSGKAIPAYGDTDTLDEIGSRFSYAFGNPVEKGVWYRPSIQRNAIKAGEYFDVGTLRILPILQHHGKGKSLGYRIGNFAYCPDVDKFEESSLQLLEKLDVWLVDCLQYDPAPTHAHLALTLEWIKKLQPKRAILTHMTHAMDYQTLRNQLPPQVEPAYDGMVISFS